MPIAKTSIKPGTAQNLVRFLLRSAQDDENANAVHRTIGAYLGTIEGKQFTLREKKKALAAIEAKYKGAKAGLRSSGSFEYVDVEGGPFPRRVSVCLPRTAYVDCAAWEDSNGCTGTAAEARAKRCRYLLDNPGQINALASAIDGVRKAWALLDWALYQNEEADRGGFAKHEHPLSGAAAWLTGLDERYYGQGGCDSYYAEACGLNPGKLHSSLVLQLSKEAEK